MAMALFAWMRYVDVCSALERFELICCAAVSASMGLLACMNHTIFPFISNVANRIGGGCLNRLIPTATGGLMQLSWAERWPTIGTLGSPATPTSFANGRSVQHKCSTSHP
jgi:hypothetical protein